MDTDLQTIISRGIARGLSDEDIKAVVAAWQAQHPDVGSQTNEPVQPSPMESARVDRRFGTIKPGSPVARGFSAAKQVTGAALIPAAAAAVPSLSPVIAALPPTAQAGLLGAGAEAVRSCYQNAMSEDPKKPDMLPAVFKGAVRGGIEGILGAKMLRVGGRILGRGMAEGGGMVRVGPMPNATPTPEPPTAAAPETIEEVVDRLRQLKPGRFKEAAEQYRQGMERFTNGQ